MRRMKLEHDFYPCQREYLVYKSKPQVEPHAASVHANAVFVAAIEEPTPSMDLLLRVAWTKAQTTLRLCHVG